MNAVLERQKVCARFMGVLELLEAEKKCRSSIVSSLQKPGIGFPLIPQPQVRAEPHTLSLLLQKKP